MVVGARVKKIPGESAVVEENNWLVGGRYEQLVSVRVKL